MAASSNSESALRVGRDELGDALECLLGGRGEVTGGGVGRGGWNLDLQLEFEPSAAWIDELRAFLRAFDVSADTMIVLGGKDFLVGEARQE